MGLLAELAWRLRFEPIRAFLFVYSGSRGTNSTSSSSFQPSSREPSGWISSFRSFSFGFWLEQICTSLSGWSGSGGTNSTSSSDFQPFSGESSGQIPSP
ncbi:unnamed protein product [Prunus armeniaca]